MFQGIDLSSDTVTQPSPEMKRAMLEAPLGDEQKGEDPTTLRLEKLMAERLGKSAAIFLPSATLSNQVAIHTLCEPGDEVIADANAHIFIAECGGGAIHSGVMTKPLQTANGIFTGADVRRHTRWMRSPLTPVSRLVSVENTTNMGGGVAWTAAQLADVVEAAREGGLSLHMDGARLFNASIRSGLSPKSIASSFDTITVCLSKGLGCAAGAVLAFDERHYDRVRRWKQAMGGALRQSGILSAAGIYALEHHVERLAEDHRHAAQLADGLARIDQLQVENPEPSTNMVFFSWKGAHPRGGSSSGSEWLARCIKKGVRFSQVDQNRFRAVTHLDVREADIDTAVKLVQSVCSEI
jgi:threonine aldolase